MNSLKRSSRGLTLTEVMLVILFVSIFAGMAIPALSSTIARHQVDDAATKIAHAIEFAKVLAQARNEPISLTFAGGTVTMKRSNGTVLKTVGLPSRVSLSGLNAVEVSTMGGFSNTGTITLTSTLDNTRTKQVVLASSYGSVTVN